MHQRETGQHVITATTTNDEKAERISEWIDTQFDGNDSAAVWYALNQQMQRDEASKHRLEDEE